MPKVIKPSNPFTNACWVSVLTTFSALPQIWLHRQFSSLNSRNEEMMGDGFLGATVIVMPILNIKRLFTISCNK